MLIVDVICVVTAILLLRGFLKIRFHEDAIRSENRSN
jgi:hypothetical protein